MEERTGSGLVFSCRCQVGVQHQGQHMGRLPRRHEVMLNSLPATMCFSGQLCSSYRQAAT